MSKLTKGRPRKWSAQLVVRLSEDQLARLERFLAHLNASKPGMSATRADAIRIVIEHGLRELEKLTV